jgi:hypothetical protein
MEYWSIGVLRQAGTALRPAELESPLGVQGHNEQDRGQC